MPNINTTYIRSMNVASKLEKKTFNFKRFANVVRMSKKEESNLQ